ncbi:MAG: NfeD family protein [Candidatus Marinimicrobia bacterium]|nr:NfeD family protein [Candidatus Neomarinimicrobiota bacterium]
MDAIANFFTPPLIWFLIGLLLVLLEFIIPGVIVIFFGFGAWVTMILVWIFKFGINMQILVCLVSSLVLLVVLRKKLKTTFVGRSESGSDDKVDDVIGKKVKVTSKISIDDPGKILLNGVQWNAEADVDIEEGAIVEILSKNNLTFKVKPKEYEND